MSFSRVFAPGLAEERFDQVLQALDTSQCADGEPMHLIFALYPSARDLP